MSTQDAVSSLPSDDTPIRKRKERTPLGKLSQDGQRAKPKTHKKNNPAKVDLRKQLFNSGKCGDIKAIMVPFERITKLNAILFDIDPDKFRKDGLLGKVSRDPQKFFKETLHPMLDRHPTLAKCEVRMTGTGLHVLLRLAPAVEFHDENERKRWAVVVEVVQAALPIDPDQPGILATTRKLGSVNSKNGAKVVRLHKGEEVSPEEVLRLFEEIRFAPFKTVTGILTGDSRVSPCPICRGEGTSMRAMPHVGECYGSCGTLKISDLYASVLAPRKKAKATNSKAKPTQTKKTKKKHTG